MKLEDVKVIEILESENEEGEIEQFAVEINNPKYGRCIYITKNDNFYDIEYYRSDDSLDCEVIKTLKTLNGCIRWIYKNIIIK